MRSFCEDKGQPQHKNSYQKGEVVTQRRRPEPSNINAFQEFTCCIQQSWTTFIYDVVQHVLLLELKLYINIWTSFGKYFLPSLLCSKEKKNISELQRDREKMFSLLMKGRYIVELDWLIKCESCHKLNSLLFLFVIAILKWQLRKPSPFGTHWVSHVTSNIYLLEHMPTRIIVNLSYCMFI